MYSQLILPIYCTLVTAALTVVILVRSFRNWDITIRLDKFACFAYDQKLIEGQKTTKIILFSITIFRLTTIINSNGNV